jgi:hypothetical protein
MRTLVIFVVFAVAAFGQRHKLEELDTEKPEGKLLQQIMQEGDVAKKIAMMEQFLEQFPKTEATAAVLEQLQGAYVKTGQHDKVILTGDKLLAIDVDDPEAALQSLKAAEAKKDALLIKKYSAMASAAARKMAATPKPAEADEVESWKSEVDYAKQVDTYTEYALYAAALESRDPKLTIELAEMLQQRNPTGEYTVKAQQPLFVAYRQSGANDKAVALAEKVLATDQSNEDMLLVVADHYLQNKKEPEKVHAYSAKIVEVMSTKAKPEGTSDAEWTNRKNLVVGLAHYMNGKLYYNEGRFAQADQALRSALPLVESNATLKPEVLYLLGFANYKLEKAQDAANFYRACAAIKSPFQATAAKNLQGIKAQYTGIK